MTREVILTAGQPQEFYEVGDFLRILSAAGPLTIEFYNQGREVSEAVNVSKGYAEKFDRGTFDRVRLVSATTQPVQFVTRLGNVVLYDAAPVGDTAIVFSVPLSLDAATLAEEKRPALPVSNWKDTSNIAVNTPLTIFTAAANVNGAIVWSMEANDSALVSQTEVFIAKATAPTTFNDGEVIAQSVNTVRSDAASVNWCAIRREVPTRIAPGLGLYFISNGAGSGGFMRNCRYTLL